MCVCVMSVLITLASWSRHNSCIPCVSPTDVSLDGLRNELKSADKSLEATLTKTIGELKGKITALENQVQRLSGCASKPCANGGVCKVTDDGFQCDCSKANGFVGPRCEDAVESSCKALYAAGKTTSGIYTLKSKDGKKFGVLPTNRHDTALAC